MFSYQWILPGEKAIIEWHCLFYQKGCFSIHSHAYSIENYKCWNSNSSYSYFSQFLLLPLLHSVDCTDSLILKFVKNPLMLQMVISTVPVCHPHSGALVPNRKKSVAQSNFVTSMQMQCAISHFISRCCMKAFVSHASIFVHEYK